jgi:hypothetical protein
VPSGIACNGMQLNENVKPEIKRLKISWAMPEKNTPDFLNQAYNKSLGG